MVAGRVLSPRRAALTALTTLLTLGSCSATRLLTDVDIPRPVIHNAGDELARANYLTAPKPNGGAITVEPFLSVGGSAGTPAFFWDPGHGGFMQRLDVWTGDNSVAGIKMLLTSGAEKMWGTEQGAAQTLILSPGEKLTELTLWDNGVPEPLTRFGALRLSTDANQTFDAGLPDGQRGGQFPIVVGSGFVLAASGRTGAEVAAFGLCFLREIASARLSVLSYPALQTLSPASANSTAILAKVNYNNFGDSEEIVRMAGSPLVTATHNWTFGTEDKLGVPVTLRAGVPRVVDTNGIPTNWTVTEAAEWRAQSTEEVRRVYDLPVTVPAHTSVEAKATLAVLDVDLDFNGRVDVTVDNGAIWDYKMSGRYDGLAYAVLVSLENEHSTRASDTEPEKESKPEPEPVLVS